MNTILFLLIAMSVNCWAFSDGSMEHIPRGTAFEAVANLVVPADQSTHVLCGDKLKSVYNVCTVRDPSNDKISCMLSTTQSSELRVLEQGTRFFVQSADRIHIGNYNYVGTLKLSNRSESFILECKTELAGIPGRVTDTPSLQQLELVLSKSFKIIK